MAIDKEMKKAIPAFEKPDDITCEDTRNGTALIEYQEINCHMVFDVKMDGSFTRKARFVAGGHTTEPPATATYSSVVTRESVRIAFLVAALNDLEIKCCNILNAYLNAPCLEQIWTQAGREFGDADKGSCMVIVRALYGLQSSGKSWSLMISWTMRDMGFTSCKADADLWLRAAVKPDGTKYYEYVLVYVDEILCVSQPRCRNEDNWISL